MSHVGVPRRRGQEVKKFRKMVMNVYYEYFNLLRLYLMK